MSRGWESKSVESQMEEAALRRSAPKETPLTAEQLRIKGERESLELSRKRVLDDLAFSVTHPRRREQLQSALRHLDEKTRRVYWNAPAAMNRLRDAFPVIGYIHLRAVGRNRGLERARRHKVVRVGHAQGTPVQGAAPDGTQDSVDERPRDDRGAVL